jgi:hypothetical protein
MPVWSAAMICSVPRTTVVIAQLMLPAGTGVHQLAP